MMAEQSVEIDDHTVTQNVITRSEWGAKAPKSRRVLRDTTSPTLHWNGPATKLDEHSSQEDEIRYLKGVQKFHMDTRGWSDIAYNFAFAPSGRVYELRGWKIRSAANGTTKGNNASHAFLLMMGEGDPEATQALIDSVRRMRAIGDSKYVKAHRDWKSTACPGEDVARLVREGKFEGLPDGDETEEPKQPNDVPVEPTVITKAVKPDTSALRLQIADLKERLKWMGEAVNKLDGVAADIDSFTGE